MDEHVSEEMTDGATENNTVVLSGGGVEYALAEAAERIDDVIEALENARSEGAEYVVMSSGNYRGAQWAKVGSSFDWAGEGY